MGFRYLILSLAFSISLFSQELMQNDFDVFKMELQNYEKALDSTATIQQYPCETYLLKWQVYIQNNSGWNVGHKANLSELCTYFTQDAKTRKWTCKKASRKKSIHGESYYTFRYIGSKYVIVTMELATGSINRTIYYFERNE